MLSQPDDIVRHICGYLDYADIHNIWLYDKHLAPILESIHTTDCLDADFLREAVNLKQITGKLTLNGNVPAILYKAKLVNVVIISRYTFVGWLSGTVSYIYDFLRHVETPPEHITFFIGGHCLVLHNMVIATNNLPYFTQAITFMIQMWPIRKIYLIQSDHDVPSEYHGAIQRFNNMKFASTYNLVNMFIVTQDNTLPLDIYIYIRLSYIMLDCHPMLICPDVCRFFQSIDLGFYLDHKTQLRTAVTTKLNFLRTGISSYNNIFLLTMLYIDLNGILTTTGIPGPLFTHFGHCFEGDFTRHSLMTKVIPAILDCRNVNACIDDYAFLYDPVNLRAYEADNYFIHHQYTNIDS